MVGLSDQWYRPSHFVAKYLQQHGYRIFPVNPRLAGGTLLGETVVANLLDLKEPVEMVDVFRRTEDVLPIAEAAVKIGARVLWQQQKLDEALAIRDHIRTLKGQLLQARPDPGSLGEELPEVGIDIFYELIGSIDGAVWGTDFYTADSHLASVAVHAGVLREGESGVVRVKSVDTSNIRFVGTERNGVRSMPFATWPTGFQVARA